MTLVTNQPKPKELPPLYDVPDYVRIGYRRFGRDWVAVYLHKDRPYRNVAYFHYPERPEQFHMTSADAFQRKPRPRAGTLHT